MGIAESITSIFLKNGLLFGLVLPMVIATIVLSLAFSRGIRRDVSDRTLRGTNLFMGVVHMLLAIFMFRRPALDIPTPAGLYPVGHKVYIDQQGGTTTSMDQAMDKQIKITLVEISDGDRTVIRLYGRYLEAPLDAGAWEEKVLSIFCNHFPVGYSGLLSCFQQNRDLDIPQHFFIQLVKQNVESEDEIPDFPNQIRNPTATEMSLYSFIKVDASASYQLEKMVIPARTVWFSESGDKWINQGTEIVPETVNRTVTATETQIYTSWYKDRVAANRVEYRVDDKYRFGWLLGTGTDKVWLALDAGETNPGFGSRLYRQLHLSQDPVAESDISTSWRFIVRKQEPDPLSEFEKTLPFIEKIPLISRTRDRILIDGKLKGSAGIFSAITSLFHFMLGSSSRYPKMIRNKHNPFRWIEYSITSGIMIANLGNVCEIDRLNEVLALFFFTSITNFFGMAIEESKAKWAKWTFMGVGFIPFIIPFYMIGDKYTSIYKSFIQILNDENRETVEENLVLVALIVVLISLLYCTFPAIQIAQILNPSRYATGEWWFIVCSLLSKVTLNLWAYYSGSRPNISRGSNDSNDSNDSTD